MSFQGPRKILEYLGIIADRIYIHKLEDNENKNITVI